MRLYIETTSVSYKPRVCRCSKGQAHSKRAGLVAVILGLSSSQSSLSIRADNCYVLVIILRSVDAWPDSLALKEI